MKRYLRLLGLLAIAAIFTTMACEVDTAEPSSTPGGLPTPPVFLTRSPVASTPTSAVTCPTGSSRFSLALQEAYEFQLTVTSPGVVFAEANWAGPRSLALIINGPSRANLSNPEAFYARNDGSSPLRVQYLVSKEDATRGKAWKVRVVNFDASRAIGCLSVSNKAS